MRGTPGHSAAWAQLQAMPGVEAMQEYDLNLEEIFLSFVAP